jgi:hypothetical protein
VRSELTEFVISRNQNRFGILRRNDFQVHGRNPDEAPGENRLTTAFPVPAPGWLRRLAPRLEKATYLAPPVAWFLTLEMVSSTNGQSVATITNLDSARFIGSGSNSIR